MPPKIVKPSARRSGRINKAKSKEVSAFIPTSTFNRPDFVSSIGVVGRLKSVRKSSTIEVVKPKRTRRRKPLKSSWPREITKTKREHGQAYLGYERTDNGKVFGVQREERKLGPRCSSDFCRKSKLRNCHNIDEGERVANFERFWADLTWNQKEIYVLSLVDMERPKTNASENSRRSATGKYFLKVGGKRLQVCKKFFLSSFGLNEWQVAHWANAGVNGMIPAKEILNVRRKECRPLSNKALADKKKKDFLVQFLDDLPKMPSHYCRARTDKKYLEPNFQSLAELYRYYQMCCNDSSGGNNSIGDGMNVPPEVFNESNEQTNESKNNSLSYGFFTDVFKDLKLGLYQPKKDQCELCVGFANENITAEEYNNHISQKERARQEKEEDKIKAEAGQAHVLAWDVEAVKLVPVNKAGILYFKSKLKNHNFSIYDMESTDCVCNWWHEAEGGMDSSVFVTCAIDYLRENCTDDLPVIIWSDGCCYQNRNQMLSNALLDYAVQNKKTIQQKFLVKGHTQMEVDNVHAVIENKIKNRNINLPSDYIAITEKARLTLPLRTRTLRHEDFRNYNDTRLFRYNSIRPGKGKGDDTVQDLRMLQYNVDGTISFKTDFDHELQPLPRKPKIPTRSYEQLERLYKEPLKISKQRYNDLQDLKVVLPKKAHRFYETLNHE